MPSDQENEMSYREETMTTEALEADVAAGGYGVRTHPRQARELLRLGTVAHRIRADREAWTLGNLRGGRPSDNVNAAVNDLLRMIEQGREADEMYGERVAREQREREAELRQVVPGAIYHHPAMRRA